LIPSSRLRAYVAPRDRQTVSIGVLATALDVPLDDLL